MTWNSSDYANITQIRLDPGLLWIPDIMLYNTYVLTLETLFTVYPKKYAHGFVVLYFVVVMQSLIMNSHEVFIHIHQGCFAGTGAIVRLPQCQWSKPDGYGKISQCITTTKHSKAKTVCIFLGIYCSMTAFRGNIIHRWLIAQRYAGMEFRTIFGFTSVHHCKYNK